MSAPELSVRGVGDVARRGRALDARAERRGHQPWGCRDYVTGDTQELEVR